MVFNSCNKKLMSGCRLVFDAFNLISCFLFRTSNFVKLQLEIGFAVRDNIGQFQFDSNPYKIPEAVKYLSASSAAIQPEPAAVTACL